MFDGDRAGASDGSSEEELDVVFEDGLEGVSEGESESVCGKGSKGTCVGESVGVGRVVCEGVGSRGSEHTGLSSATYHTSLCLFDSFKGLHTRNKRER